MKSITYPSHFRQQFQRTTVAATMVEPRHSPVVGTDTCKCGYVLTAPDASTCWPLFVINEWCCSKCGERWETAADFRDAFH